MNSEERFEAIAQQYETVADELQLAIDHLHDVAMHFRNAELARAGAHAFSTQGHIKKAETLLSELAVLQAENSFARSTKRRQKGI